MSENQNNIVSRIQRLEKLYRQELLVVLMEKPFDLSFSIFIQSDHAHQDFNKIPYMETSAQDSVFQ